MKKNIILVTLLSLFLTLEITIKDFKVLNILTIFIMAFLLIYFLFTKKNTLKENKGKILKKEFLIYTLLIIIPLIIAIVAYYPGIGTTDTSVQWNQVQTNLYNNWHPIFHTLIFMKLPSLFYNNLLSCTIFQTLFILLILLYFCYFLRKNFLNYKQTIILLMLIVLNPIFLKYSVTIWKDIPYTWSLFLLTLSLIDIVKSDGEWLKNNFNKLLFIVSSLGVFLFRHNGLVPFVLTFVLLIIFYPKLRKFLTITLISSLVGYYGVCGFFFDLTTGGKAEMIGVVLGQINYYYNNEVEFSKDELEVMDKLSPIENWKKYYNARDFNGVKWASSTFQEEASKKENFNKIISMWFHKSLKNPFKFLESYLAITSPIWEIKNNFSDVDYQNTRELTNTINYKTYDKLVSYNKIIVDSPMRWLFTDFGDGLFLIVLGLFLIIKKTKFNIKKWIPFLPVIFNTLVIMLLITGKEYRFVYPQVVCCYPLLLYSLYEKEEKDFKSKLVKFFKNLFVNKTDNSLIQFVRYFFVGGIAAVVNIGMLYVFTDLLHIYYLISNIFSFTLGLIVNYLLSKKLVFQDEKNINKSKEFLIYAVIGVLGLGIDTLFMGLFTGIMKIYYMLSKIISTMLVFIWNFVARKVFYKIIK